MASEFALEIVTPEEIFYQDDVEMVITRTTQGDRAVLKNHIPFVAGLVDGELRIKKDGKWGVVNSEGTIIQEPIYELKWENPSFIGKYYKVQAWGEQYYSSQIEQ